MKNLLAALFVLVMFTAWGCSPYTGFVPMAKSPQATGAPTPPERITLHASLDVGKPYQILGYVYRQVMTRKEGATDLGDETIELSYSEDVVKDLKKKAAAHGADAIVGLNLDGAVNGYGQPICTSIGGWAVEFE
jgi:hypothetical protein